jgi:hypothetical protein
MEPSVDPLQAAESDDTPASPSANPAPPSPAISEVEPAHGSPVEIATSPEVEAVSEAEPAPAPAPETAEIIPGSVIASTVTIPAQLKPTDGGGEWDLLVEKIKAWIDSKELGSIWSQAQLPLRLIGGLILFVIVSSIYSGILGTINKVPLAPRLLELTGVIWLLNYARCNLVRSSDRKRVIDSIGSTWNKFVGR